MARQTARHERMLAESQGFEPWRRFWRLHDFQSCSFGHSDNSPTNAGEIVTQTSVLAKLFLKLFFDNLVYAGRRLKFFLFSLIPTLRVLYLDLIYRKPNVCR